MKTKIIVVLILIVVIVTFLYSCERNNNVIEDETYFVYYGQNCLTSKQGIFREELANKIIPDVSEFIQIRYMLWSPYPINMYGTIIGEGKSSIQWGIPTLFSDISKKPKSYKITYTKEDKTDGIVVDKWLYLWNQFSQNILEDTEIITSLINDCLGKEDCLQKTGFINSYPNRITSYDPIVNFLTKTYSNITVDDISGDYDIDTIDSYLDLYINNAYHFEYYLLGGVLGASAVNLYNYVDFSNLAKVDAHLKLYSYSTNDSVLIDTNKVKNIVGYYTSDVDDLLLEPVSVDRSNTGTSVYDRIIDYYLHPVIYVV